MNSAQYCNGRHNDRSAEKSVFERYKLVFSTLHEAEGKR